MNNEVVYDEGDINSVCPKCEEAVCQCTYPPVITNEPQEDITNGIDLIYQQQPGIRLWCRQMVHFNIQIEKSELDCILARDTSNEMVFQPTLYDYIMKINGINYVDYNLRIGHWISIYLNDGDFGLDGQEQVEKTIKEYLNPE